MSAVIFTRNLQRRLRVNRPRLQQLAAAALKKLNSPLEVLGIILVNDAQIAEYNRQFHHREGPTDVLTFQYEGMGELVISTEQAIANARRFRTTPRRELALYIIHGILHLHGYDDATPAQRRRMRAAERRLLRSLF